MAFKRKILFFIPNMVQVLDLTGPVQVFLEANNYGAEYELLYCSLTSQVISCAGLSFSAVQPYSNFHLQSGDYIFLPGAEMEYLRSEKFKSETAFFEWLAKNYKAGIGICSICTGAFILAETGLLDLKYCTTHWKRIAELKKSYPALQTINDVLYTHENNLYTSAGVTSGIDLSLAIVEEHYGALVANKVSRELLVYYRRSGNHSQVDIYLNYRNHIHSGIHTIQDWIIQNLETKFTITQLSSIVNMGERNMTRVFKKATGITINEYAKQLKLERLKTLINNKELKSDVIAGKIGYKSARQLQRIKKLLNENKK